MSAFAALADRAAALAVEGRALLGIAGAPGAGKTTLALRLVDALTQRGIPAAHVPMDGFHLADVALDRLGLRGRKGAIETFDADGYLALLRRLRVETRTVYAPAFDRTIEQPIAQSIGVEPGVRVVVSEGNYLLAAAEGWREVRTCFDEVWYAHVAHLVRLERLHERHVRFGKTPAAATEWIDRVDEPNARTIEARSDRADLVVDIDALD